MKNLYIIACVLFLSTSCGTEKEATSTTTTTTTETTVDNDDNIADPDDPNDPLNNGNGNVLVTDGVVRDKGTDGCGFIIQMMVDANTETTTYYEPLELPKEYQEEGKLIRIEYRMSRRPSKCTLAIPIIIDAILSK
jgi:hypothetical protein